MPYGIPCTVKQFVLTWSDQQGSTAGQIQEWRIQNLIILLGNRKAIESYRLFDDGHETD